MRSGIVAVGIVLLIFGVLGYWFGSAVMQSIEQYGFLGDLARMLSSDINQRYQIGRLISYAGLLFIAIGFITFIAGFAVSSEKPPEKIVEKFVICPVCHSEVALGSRFCPKCGTKIEEQK